MVIKVNYKKNAEVMTDFYRVLTRATQRKKVIALRVFYAIFGTLGLLCGGLLLFVGTSQLIAFMGVLAGAFFLVKCIFYYTLLGSAAKRLMVKEIDSATYFFDDDDIAIDDALEHCAHPYDVFQGAYESRRIFLLLLTARTGYLIAKSDLSESDEMEVRRILQEKFPKGLVYYDI